MKSLQMIKTALALLPAVLSTTAYACWGTNIDTGSHVVNNPTVGCPGGSSLTCQYTEYRPSDYYTRCTGFVRTCNASTTCDFTPVQPQEKTDNYQSSNNGCTACTGPSVPGSWSNSGSTIQTAGYVPC